MGRHCRCRRGGDRRVTKSGSDLAADDHGLLAWRAVGQGRVSLGRDLRRRSRMIQGTPQSNLDLELLAAQLRRHADDMSLYSGMLLNVLSATLPDHMLEVRRES